MGSLPSITTIAAIPPAGTREALPGRGLPVHGRRRDRRKIQQFLGVGFHETAKDGSVTLEPVYCLGLCAGAPTAMLDGEVIGRLDAERLEEIVEEVRA